MEVKQEQPKDILFKGNCFATPIKKIIIVLECKDMLYVKLIFSNAFINELALIFISGWLVTIDDFHS